MEAVKWAADYLGDVEVKVGEAIADGKTLEETIAAVKAEDFQGYALFGWVHPGLNVPAAYRDLK
jgi:hypothetical protein